MHNTKLNDKQTEIIEKDLKILVNEQYPLELDKIIDERIKGCYYYINLHYKIFDLNKNEKLHTIIRTKQTLSPDGLKKELKEKYQTLYNNGLKNGFIRIIIREVLTCQKFKKSV